MKNYFICTILICSFLIPNLTLAQIEARGMDDVYTKLKLNEDIRGIKDYYKYQEIEGNPYIFKNFSEGTIKLKKSNPIQGNFRYDKYAGEVHFKKDDNMYAIAFPKEVEYIQIDSLRFIHSEFSESDKKPTNNEGTYFIVEVDGNYKLLVKKNVSIKDAKATNGIIPASNAKFVAKNDTYFIKKQDKPAIKIQNEKSILSLFLDKNPEISNYIKSNRLKVKKLEDLKEIVNYYNLLNTTN